MQPLCFIWGRVTDGWKNEKKITDYEVEWQKSSGCFQMDSVWMSIWLTTFIKSWPFPRILNLKYYFCSSPIKSMIYEFSCFKIQVICWPKKTYDIIFNLLHAILLLSNLPMSCFFLCFFGIECFLSILSWHFEYIASVSYDLLMSSRAGILLEPNLGAEVSSDVTSSSGPVKLEDLQRILSNIDRAGVLSYLLKVYNIY